MYRSSFRSYLSALSVTCILRNWKPLVVYLAYDCLWQKLLGALAAGLSECSNKHNATLPAVPPEDSKLYSWRAETPLARKFEESGMKTLLRIVGMVVICLVLVLVVLRITGGRPNLRVV